MPIDATVIDLINSAQTAAMDAQVVRTSGAGKAYQSVAQSTAIAIQDATDALRNVSTIATAAAGVALAHILAGDTQSKYTDALKSAQDIMTAAVTGYGQIGEAAGKILANFPSGQQP